MNRREFLHAAAAAVAAAEATAAAAEAPARMKGLPAQARPPTDKDRARLAALRALDVARSKGASYADVRVVRLRRQHLSTRDDHLVDLQDDESYGGGVRVLVKGVWGFAAVNQVGEAALGQAAERAVRLAQANQRIPSRPVTLAPVTKVQTRWVAPFQIDPFVLPIENKAELLFRAAQAAREIKAGSVQLRVDGRLSFVREEKTFYSSEGSIIEQLIIRSAPHLLVTAIDRARGEFEARGSQGDFPPRTLGWEYLARDKFVEQAPRWAEDAVRRLRAPEVSPGDYDLILHPSNLYLTIHETVGHSTELDRVLGYEANLAGTSFATLPNLGRLQYGAPNVNLIADRTQPEGLATVGYDDDGDVAQRWYLIRQGKLVGYQTTREQAGWINEEHGRGCSYADSWSSVPFQRMPNVSLEPSAQPLSLEELIGDSKRAIYIEGSASYSIDQQRYNFQFSGGSFYLIENGKRKTPLRRLAYQGNTLQFWRGCDRVCDQREYRLGGVMDDGKGEPGQSNAVSHGCPAARFRNVRVLRTAGKAGKASQEGQR